MKKDGCSTDNPISHKIAVKLEHETKDFYSPMASGGGRRLWYAADGGLKGYSLA